MNRWKSVIVTGGGSGIGRRMVEMLLARGAQVAVIDRNIDEAVRLVLENQLEPGSEAGVCFFQADVTDSNALTGAVASAVAVVGAPDLAVNCAGVQIAKPFDELAPEEFEQVVSVNLFGSRNFAAAALPHMKAGSQLVLVASLAGLVSSHSYAAYNASKFGVVGLAGALRLEYISRGIEVSVVCPPEVNTPMVVEERKTLSPVGARLKSTAGTLELEPACDAIMAQLYSRRFTVIPGVRARLVAALARLFPGVMRYFSERIVLAGAD